MNVVYASPSDLVCEFGCNVEFKRILVDHIPCELNPTVNCTDPQILRMEIQPSQDGENVSCDVNGITVIAEYQFWYEPNGGVHLTTPKSKFLTNTFDSAPFFGGWSVITWLGCEFIVTELKNNTGACGGPCNEIVCQSGMLVPYKDCIQRRDTTEIPDQDLDITNPDDWQPVMDGDAWTKT